VVFLYDGNKQLKWMRGGKAASARSSRKVLRKSRAMKALVTSWSLTQNAGHFESWIGAYITAVSGVCVVDIGTILKSGRIAGAIASLRNERQRA